MNIFTDLISQESMRRALVGGALVGFTNGFLGSFVILRRMSLMADALSHSMLPGLAIGVMLFGLNPAGLFSGGLVAAMFVAIGALLLARLSRVKEDAALAILYTVAFSIGVVLLQMIPRSQVDLKHYLFGNVGVLANADLWISYGVALVVVPGLILLQRPMMLTLFDPAVARSQGVKVGALNFVLIVASVLTMISSVQSVGVILMLGLLVTPAATMYLLTDNFTKMLWGGAVLGCLGSTGGLVVSYKYDGIPSGAAIVLVLGVAFFVALICSPRYGLFVRLRKSRHFHEESLKRWEHDEPHKH